MRKFVAIIFVVVFAGMFTQCGTAKVDITGNWIIDSVEISGYPEEEKALYQQLEKSLEGGKITIYEDGRIDTYSNINGEESIVTKKYDYSDPSKFCIIDENEASDCLTVKDWTNEKMVAETTDNGLTIEMVFVKK
jgi:hypothetical protein